MGGVHRGSSTYMSRRKKDEELEKVEQLERDNKSLRTMNRSLMRRLKKLDREFREDINNELDESDLPNQCRLCFKGQTREQSLGPRKMITCTVCDRMDIEKA